MTFIVNGEETKVEPQSTIGECAELALQQTGHSHRDITEFHAHLNSEQLQYDWELNDLGIEYGHVITSNDRIFLSLKAGVGA